MIPHFMKTYSSRANLYSISTIFQCTFTNYKRAIRVTDETL